MITIIKIMTKIKLLRYHLPLTTSYHIDIVYIGSQKISARRIGRKKFFPCLSFRVVGERKKRGAAKFFLFFCES